jgi:hypothetical protein
MKKLFQIKILFLFLLLFGFSSTMKAQKIKNIKPVRNGNTIVVNYTLSAKFNQKFNVSLYVSRDGGETFEGPLEAVNGDVGEGIRPGQKKIIWDVFKEVYTLKGDIVFDVRAEVIEEEVPRQFIISLMGSIDAPLGFTIGQVGKIGWYVSAKTGMNFSKPEYTYEGENWNPGFEDAQYYKFNSTEDLRRLSITGGITWQLGKNFFVYTGGGYGMKEHLWQMELYDYEKDSKTGEEYVQQPDYTYTGLEAEGGVIFRMKNFLLSAGATTVNFKYTNWTLGIGWAF